MNRRSFLKGIAAAAAGAFVAPELILPEQPERRFWQLDSTMARGDVYVTEWWDTRWFEVLDDTRTPFLDRIAQDRDIFPTTHEWGQRYGAPVPSGGFVFTVRGPVAEIAPIPDEILDLTIYE